MSGTSPQDHGRIKTKLQLFASFDNFNGICKLVQMGLAASKLCDSAQRQTMSHIVDSCQVMKLDGGLTRFNEANYVAVNWLKDTAASAISTRQINK